MKLEINIERTQSISDAIFDALTTFLGDNLDFHGEQHTEWIYRTADQIMNEINRPNGQSIDDLQDEIDDIQRSIDGVVNIED